MHRQLRLAEAVMKPSDEDSNLPHDPFCRSIADPALACAPRLLNAGKLGR
jgi:hypothetical protein